MSVLIRPVYFRKNAVPSLDPVKALEFSAFNRGTIYCINSQGLEATFFRITGNLS